LVTGHRVLAVVLVALTAVFAAIALSVVDARRPFDKQVVESFTAALSRAQPQAVETALGCRKERVDFYNCAAALRHPRRRRSLTVHYRVWLRGDLCWSAQRLSPLQPEFLRAGLRRGALEGCLAS
jgi:hypothetical protein